MNYYTTEEDIFIRVKEKMSEKGHNVTLTQLRYLYNAINKYFYDKSTDSSTFSIVIPHVGTLYVSSVKLNQLKSYYKNKSNRNKVKLLSDKIKELEKLLPDHPIHKSTFLRKTRKLIRNNSFKRIIDNQNKYNV